MQFIRRKADFSKIADSGGILKINIETIESALQEVPDISIRLKNALKEDVRLARSRRRDHVLYYCS